MHQIKYNFARYSNHEISIQELISKASRLTTGLLVNQLEVAIPKKKSERVSMMVANYYIMIYLDMYTACCTVEKSFIYEQKRKMIDEVNSQNETDLELTDKIKFGEHLSIKSKTSDKKNKEIDYQYPKEQLDIYYIHGLEGCQMKLVRSIHSEFTSVDTNDKISEKKIEEILRSTLADKFLNSNNIGF